MKRQILLSVLCVAAAAALLLWGSRQSAPVASVERARFALLIEDDTGTFLMQLRKGMQEAAAEENASLRVLAREEAEDLSGFAAVLLLLNDPLGWLQHDAPKDCPPVLAVGEKVEGLPCVWSDDESTATRLMARALELAPAEKILLLCDDGDERSQTRSRAAERFGAEHGVSSLPWREQGVEPPIGYEAVVCMSQRATVALVAMKRGGEFAGEVLGIDTGESRASDLEDGAARVLALDNPYAMGYIALKQASHGLGTVMGKHGDAPGSQEARVLLAERDNMYLPENVKQVFPLLQ